MMKVSTKGRYGVRAMFYLATQYDKGPIALRTIAEHQEISEHYLEQLIAILRKNGLVKSIRGAQGGYLLARAPEAITAGDIIRTLEGPIAPVDCVVEDDSQDCNRVDICMSRMIWQRVRNSMIEVLDGITLADMCQQSEALGKEGFVIGKQGE